MIDVLKVDLSDPAHLFEVAGYAAREQPVIITTGIQSWETGDPALPLVLGVLVLALDGAGRHVWREIVPPYWLWDEQHGVWIAMPDVIEIQAAVGRARVQAGKEEL